MARVYNFSAGPAVLPEEVLKEAAEEMLDYKGTGMSVMEMSHRSKVYDSIIKGAEQLLRELYNIPENYKVLFLPTSSALHYNKCFHHIENIDNTYLCECPFVCMLRIRALCGSFFIDFNRCICNR